MPESLLTVRQLNRTMLARQWLLERAALEVDAALTHLVALQAQAPYSPFVALWSRLTAFTRDTLASAIHERRVVKTTLLRATLHLSTAADYRWLRGTVAPVLDAASEAIRKARESTIDLAGVISTAHTFLNDAPRSFAEISALLETRFPGVDVGAMRYTVRTQLPLVQVPNDSPWCFPGNPQFTPAESWLGGAPLPVTIDEPALVRRALAVWGPASAADLQRWTGLKSIRQTLTAMRAELHVYRDTGRRELFDLPDLPLPDPDTPAPMRLLPEFDNLLLAYEQRTRVLDAAYHKRVYLPGLRVAATFLVDGFTAGVWRVEKTHKDARLVLEPFGPLAAADRQALTAEAEALIRFLEPQAKTHTVRFAEV